MTIESQMAKRFVDNDGQDATLRTFSYDGTRDEQGDPVPTESDTSVKVVKGFGTSTRVPERLYRQMGDSRPMDFEFIIKTEDAPSEPQTTGKLPLLIVDNKTYRILDIEPMRIGITRMICESKRSHE